MTNPAPAAFVPRVVDISHHNTGTLSGGVIDFGAMRDAGIWGVIGKATQGSAYKDPLYASRRKDATRAGLLWGAYHFNTGDKVSDQVDNFLACADPDDKMLLVLDFEDNRLSQMSIGQAIEFLHLVEVKVGRAPAIYSGNRVKDNIGKLSSADRTYLTSHRLWLCEYGPHAVLPAGWKSWWLWQYTGDGIGPQPHSIAGIKGSGIDLNVYAGTREQLAQEWAA